MTIEYPSNDMSGKRHDAPRKKRGRSEDPEPHHEKPAQVSSFFKPECGAVADEGEDLESGWNSEVLSTGSLSSQSESEPEVIVDHDKPVPRHVESSDDSLKVDKSPKIRVGDDMGVLPSAFVEDEKRLTVPSITPCEAVEDECTKESSPMPESNDKTESFWDGFPLLIECPPGYQKLSLSEGAVKALLQAGIENVDFCYEPSPEYQAAKRYPCVLGGCGVKDLDIAFLYAHINSHHATLRDRLYMKLGRVRSAVEKRTPECKSACKTLNGLVDHIKAKHYGVGVRCALCGADFDDVARRMEMHLRSSNGCWKLRAARERKESNVVERRLS